MKPVLARIPLLALRLLRTPLLLTVLLALGVWWGLDNIVVAFFVASLLVILATMLHRLIIPSETSMSPNTHTRLPFACAVPVGLPEPDAQALAHVQAMQTHLRQCIRDAGGFLPFTQWMQQTLYAPGLGYYTADTHKFGARQGDFTTAPELTPLFGRALAAQVHQVLHASGSLHVLEFGAGSGTLATSVIDALRALGLEPHYHILEVSPTLRKRQQQRLAPLQARVQWRDTLPAHFIGCVIANEVLDAMPVTRFRWDETGQLMELGVVEDDTLPATQHGAFAWAQRRAAPHLTDTLGQRMPALPAYCSECNLQGETWVRQLGGWLHQGAALLIDYGFPQCEYYHPQRADGTLMCHLRHYAHADPLIYPGMQDITAHVDFTAMADAALAGGLKVLGYTSQARFLVNCGLLPLLDQAMSRETAPQARARMQSAVQTLISEAEMGELFKVLAVGCGINTPLTGFSSGDRCHRL